MVNPIIIKIAEIQSGGIGSVTILTSKQKPNNTRHTPNNATRILIGLLASFMHCPSPITLIVARMTIVGCEYPALTRGDIVEICEFFIVFKTRVKPSQVNVVIKTLFLSYK